MELQPAEAFEWYIFEGLPSSAPGGGRALRLGPFSSERECCELLASIRQIPRFHHDCLEVRKKRKRRDRRFPLELAAELRRPGAAPQPIRTLDISYSGARVAGLQQPLKPGEVVEIANGQRRADFRVVWIGSPGSPTTGQAGVECLAPDANIWELDLSEPHEDDNPLLREIAAARAVQSKLLPQDMPPLATLDYAGDCVQARLVGGDYYDFLDMGPGEVGLVLADIAGKGVAAALLMANLQGALRSQYRAAGRDPARLLAAVNRHLYQHSERDRYATIFLGCYRDATRTLRYVNAGHCSPLLLRRQGAVQTLPATATVLGLFPEWRGSMAETPLAPGDLLAIYSDGITEAADHRGDEFGQARLLDVLRQNSHLEPARLLRFLQEAVRQFCGGEPADDLTLLLARAR